MELRHEHWISTKHRLRYFHVTIGYCLSYASNGETQLQGYMDSDSVGSANDRNSAFDVCFSLDFVMISRMSRKQAFVTLSTIEPKYIAPCLACCEGV